MSTRPSDLRLKPPIRIAMWSGPRNLSTALMRSFGNRPDCAVSDEPFYAAYLARTGITHPMREDILAAGQQDPACVARDITGDAPGGAPLWYQKHMVHHMISDMPRDWFSDHRHAILIRDPARVLASYRDRRAEVTAADVGILETLDLYADILERTGQTPPVVDADDIRHAPRDTLTALCSALDIPFDPAMLLWPDGQRKTDGVWATHWYGSVERSTGFVPPDPAMPELTPELERLCQSLRPAYETLHAKRLRRVECSGSPA